MYVGRDSGILLKKCDSIIDILYNGLMTIIIYFTF